MSGWENADGGWRELPCRIASGAALAALRAGRQNRLEDCFQLTFDPVQALLNRGEPLVDRGEPALQTASPVGRAVFRSGAD